MQVRTIRKLAALALALVFSVSLLPAALAAGAQNFTDVAGHWGESHLAKMIEAGVIAGDGKGHAMPDKPIERYEAAVMLSKVFGLNRLDLGDAVTGHYTDIDATSPYVETYINNVIAAKFMQGSAGQFEPYRSIPREEAFTALRKALRIPDAPGAFVSRFPDFDDVPGWAEGHILAMEAAGMISGKDGKIAPADVITRAEFAALLSKGISLFIDADTDFEDAELKRAVIRKPGVTLENLTIEELILLEGVDGGVTLVNCDIGTLTVRGGETVQLVASSVTELLIDATFPGAVHVDVDEDSLVELARIYSEDATVGGDGEILVVEDHTDGGGTGGGGDLFTVAAGTVHSSVTAGAAVSGSEITITLTGDLLYDDNVFLPTSAGDFEAVTDGGGQPLAAVLDGAFTAVEFNAKAILTALGFTLVDIEQTNAALAAYEQDGGSKIDQPANIVEDNGVWSKKTFARDPSAFDDAFTVLVLGGGTATLVFTQGGDTLTVIIDATGLTVGSAA
ncbi:MAG: S-layer homology domain-containing protein [Oscillospiraceae bacterium]|jgi:hypothetical protein|nr:S-layer homology domain-containing protein [Oscillospiraceae bacterium]